MKRDLMAVFIALVLLSALTGIASADVVTLKNGDRISGDVVKMENN